VSSCVGSLADATEWLEEPPSHTPSGREEGEVPPVDSPLTHLAWAQRQSWSPALPPLAHSVESAIRQSVLLSDDELSDLRARNFIVLEEIAASNPAPPKPGPVPAPVANFAALRAALVHFGYEDPEAASSAVDLHGVSDGPAFWPVLESQADLHSLESCLAGLSEAQDAFLASVRPSEDDSILDAASRADVAAGFMRGPFQSLESTAADMRSCGLDSAVEVVTDQGRRRLPAARRFVVHQEENDRPCDDFTQRGRHVNCAAASRRKMRLPTVSTAGAMLVLYQALGIPAHTLRIWKRDHKSAYRQLLLSALACAISTVVFCDPQTGALSFWWHLRLPFGPLAAVYAYNRLGRALSFLQSTCFLSPTENYFDDYFSLEEASRADEGFDYFGKLNLLFGFNIKLPKDLRPSLVGDLLGVQVRLDSNPPSAEITASRVKKVSAEIRTVLSTGSISARESAKLGGKLGFATTATFGSLGRAALAPLFRRARGPAKPLPLSSGMSAALDFFLEFLHSAAPRPLVPPQSNGEVDIVYTDAEGSGMLGGVLVAADRSTTYFSRRTPDSVRKVLKARKNQIAAYELFAVLLAVETFGPRLRGRKVAFFIDNQTALGITRHGFTSADGRDLRRMVALLWSRLSLFQLDPAFEWVASAANLADGPSRPSCRAKMRPLLSLSPVRIEAPVTEVLRQGLQAGCMGV